MKFEFLDKFTGQKEKREQEQAELARREASALEEVQALKARYEQVIRDSLAERKDATAELDALHDKIEAAERTFKRRQQENALYHTVIKREVTEQDVVDAFNADFVPAFKEQRLNPALERLLAAKQEWIDAVADYNAAVAEFEAERGDARMETGGWASYSYYKYRDVGIQNMKQKEYYMLTDEDIRALDNGKRPNFVNRGIIE